ncbi:MAG: hypothetical protein K6A35_02815 [bacterium]|jgi:hypothetical protein|nr:hypothetical protein [bacterium]
MAGGVLDAVGGMAKGLVNAAAKKRDELMGSAELHLKVERLKGEVKSLRDEKDKLLNGIALKIYERYVQGQISDPDLRATCQAVQLKQWEIDEKWAEINRIKAAGSNAQN